MADVAAGTESGGQENAPRRSARIASGTKPPVRYVQATFVGKERWREPAAENAISAEVKQLFKELNALRPVERNAIATGACILTCHLFLVEKFLADGRFDKMKARLVSHGNYQDRADFPDRSSPTVAIQSVMMVLAAFAGQMDMYEVCKIDVKGAFVQTPMEGELIYMKIGKDLASRIVALYPEYSKFIDEKGNLYAQMMKAMYGCVQASLLWHRLLVKVLKEIGFEQCQVDPCVMRLVDGLFVNVILIYVDDLLLFATKRVVNMVLQKLKDKFQWLTVERGIITMSFLSMQLVFGQEYIIIDMVFYLEKILDGIKGLNRQSLPGTRNVFQVDKDAVLLTSEEAGFFHTITAKLLYLAKRARPDILTVISFLCTRVKEPTVEDNDKLRHLLGYLHGTRGQVLTINKPRDDQLVMYVDAAYALHEKGESHSGVVIALGGVVVFVSSKKQKCVAKSPTDAEVIALSDNIDLIRLFAEFLEFIRNEKVNKLIIFEDCKACIDLAMNAGGQMRTKQMRSRVYRSKEFFDAKEAVLVYVSTERMWADGASKPLSVVKKFGDYKSFLQGDQLLPDYKPTGGR
jgi:hypothetical protein